ncbi:Uncharacterised protein [Escherichia coli]|uniref:Uncharacterized protein n=1 Tax=Escherichia coli TaxID=562 RepID=A0A377A4C7_ECOLX|nr:Uncharacterised protein [Escherichia coli]
MLPMVTAPKLIVQSAGTSHRRSCGQTRPANFRQGVGLVRQFPPLQKYAPRWRASASSGCSCVPGISTRSMGCRTTGSGQPALWPGLRKNGLVNFNKLNFADLQRFLWRINALQVDKLINILTHCCYPLLRLHAQLSCASDYGDPAVLLHHWTSV